MASQEECRWCGNAHPVKELCRPRRVSRRMFLYALGATAAAAALPAPMFVGAGAEYWYRPPPLVDEITLVKITQRKVLARVRITREALEDLHAREPGPFWQKIREKLKTHRVAGLSIINTVHKVGGWRDGEAEILLGDGHDDVE